MFGENASAKVSGSAFQVSQIQLLVISTSVKLLGYYSYPAYHVEILKHAKSTTPNTPDSIISVPGFLSKRFIAKTCQQTTINQLN